MRHWLALLARASVGMAAANDREQTHCDEAPAQAAVLEQ